MATQTIQEVEVGSSDAPTMPYYVYDDGDTPASVSLTTALTAALAVAPPTVQGAFQTGVSYQQEADHAWRVSVQYALKRLKKLTPPVIGQERVRFSFAVAGKFLMLAEEVGAFPAGAPSYGGMLNVRSGGGGTNAVGASIPTPLENLGKQAIVSTATAASLASTIASMVGHVNSGSVGGYAAGSLMLTSFRGQQRDDDSFDLNLGWAYKANVTNEAWGDVTGVSYKGHEYVWPYTKDVVDRNENALYQTPKFVYVHKVWPTANLNSVGIYPP